MESKVNISTKEIFVILLCGVPGVGKSYFTEIFQNKFKNEEDLKTKNNMLNQSQKKHFSNFVHIINFDKLLHEKFNHNHSLKNYIEYNSESSQELEFQNNSFNYEKKFDLEFILNNFRNSRKEYFELFQNKIEELIKNDFNCYDNDNNNQFELNYLETSKRHFIVLDDNFYFKSMRKPFFKYCKDKCKKYLRINTLDQINDETINHPPFEIQISYLELHFKTIIDYAIKLNSLRSGLNKIPEQVIIRINENFQWHSFNKKLIYTINIDSFNCLRNINFHEIISKLEENKLVLREVVKNSELKTELKSLNIKNKKHKKAKFIEWLEINLRKKIGELIKSFAKNYNTNIFQYPSESSSLYSKNLSDKKKEFIQIINKLLYIHEESSFKINTPAISSTNIDLFNLNVCLENIKENNYMIDQQINYFYLEQILKEFENFSI